MRGIDKVYDMMEQVTNLIDMHERRHIDVTDDELKLVLLHLELARDAVARNVIKYPIPDEPTYQ